MKENYLHNKIRNQEEKINLLQENIKNIKSELTKIKSESSIDKMMEVLESFKASLLGKCMIDVANKVYEKNVKWNYKQLHGTIKTELKMAISSNKDMIKKFCDEATFQRKDLGIILSILFSKGIVSQNELNQLDKDIRKKMDEQRIYDKVWEIFVPILKKVKRDEK